MVGLRVYRVQGCGVHSAGFKRFRVEGMCASKEF